MANVRTLSDQRNENANRPLNQGVNNLGNNMLQRGNSDPSKEGFFEMLHINMCPKLSLISFSVFLGVSLCIIFCLQITASGINSAGEFLEINQTSFTSLLSASYEGVVARKEIWRLMTYWAVHKSLPQLVNSFIMLIIWGSYIEAFFGLWRTLSIFLLTSLAGCSFGILFAGPTDILSGASVGIVGLLGASLGFLIFNWHNISDIRFPKLFMFWMITIIIVFSLVMTNSMSSALLQAGGILAGVSCGLFLSPKYVNENQGILEPSSYEKASWVVGVSLYGFQLMTSLFFIWMLRKKNL
jgi:membrane associated rhomboid family serine protease